MEAKRQYRHRALPICTLGGAGQGKTALTAAIIKVVSRIGTTQMSDDAFLQQEPQHQPTDAHIVVNYRAIDYETSGRRYHHIDGVAHSDNARMLIGGSPEIRGALFVVNTEHGVTAEAEAELRLASQVGIATVVTFLNVSAKVDDAELLEICELETRELLAENGYTTDKAPIIIGDVAKALGYKGQNPNSEHWKPIVDLIFAMNRFMPPPQDALDLPLLLPVRVVIDNPKGSSTVYGEIGQGRLAVGASVDIVGKGERIKTRCIGLKPSSENPQESEVTVEAEPGWITPGQVIVEPKQGKSYTTFQAVVYVMTTEECGTHIPVVSNDKPDIQLWHLDVTGHVQLPPETAIINPGEHATVEIVLDVPMMLQVGVRFGIKKMGILIGIGVVTGVAD